MAATKLSKTDKTIAPEAAKKATKPKTKQPKAAPAKKTKKVNSAA
jgi:hypothetical protein